MFGIVYGIYLDVDHDEKIIKHLCVKEPTDDSHHFLAGVRLSAATLTSDEPSLLSCREGLWKVKIVKKRTGIIYCMKRLRCGKLGYDVSLLIFN